MARARLVRVVIPGSNYQVSRERKKYTKYLMNKQGQMIGRRIVPMNLSDKTGVIRMRRAYDVNKDGDTTDSVDLGKGQIIGRVPRGSYSKPKRVTILRHWRGGRIVKTYRKGV